MADTYAVTLVTPHPMARWALPLGLLGLVPLAALAVLLPKEQAATAFGIGRFVFILVYGGLIGLALSTRRQNVTLLPSLAGLHDATTHATIAASAEITDILQIPKGAAQLLRVRLRGRAALTLEVGSGETARALLDALGRSLDGGARRFLATTTPTYYSVLTWIGLPVVGAFAGQAFWIWHLAARLRADFGWRELLPYSPFLVVFLAVWLFGTYWFSRRRELLLSPTTLQYPRVFGGHDEYAYSDVESVRALDTMTATLTLRGERPRKLRIYDPDELAALLALLRARVGASAYPADAPTPAGAALTAASKTKAAVGIGFICFGVLLTVLLGALAAKQLTTMARAVPIEGTVVDSSRTSSKSGNVSYQAIVAYAGGDGVVYRVTSLSKADAPPIVGSRLRVLYDPSSPRDAMVDDFASRWTPVLMCLLGPAILLMGLWELRASRKRGAASA